MGRTAINVSGSITAGAVTSRLLGERIPAARDVRAAQRPASEERAARALPASLLAE
jgi:hypothetical protein